MEDKLSHSGVDKFFAVARERYQILLKRRAGKPKPWSLDPVFQTEYFCNVHREDDRTTQWFRENIRNVLDEANSPSELLLSIVAFRWFNRIETWQTILNYINGHSFDVIDLFRLWKTETIEQILRVCGSPPYVTGAYIIKTPDGMDKVKGVLWCIEQFQNNIKSGLFNKLLEGKASMEEACLILQQSPYLGKFMAWQVCSDTRQTLLLNKAPDKDTWAQPGPGSARGLGRVFYNNVDHFKYGNKSDEREMLARMRELAEHSKDEKYWPQNWSPIAVIDISHQLCEMDKYERCEEGGRMKRKYNAR